MSKLKKTIFTNQQHGSVSPVFLFVLMALVLIFLVYTLVNNKNKKRTQNNYYETETVVQKTEDEKIYDSYNFNDGLGKPETINEYQLNDETDEGITKTEIFIKDINKDGMADKITKTLYENGTAHFHYEYKIELNSGDRLINITPKDFITNEGADCSLQKFRFLFVPEFKIIKISRNWQESWTEPTLATRYEYSLQNNNLEITNSKPLKEICNVIELF